MGLKTSIFGSGGKSKETSKSTNTSEYETESGNRAFEALSESLAPSLNYTTQAGNMIGALLGIPGMTATGMAPGTTEVTAAPVAPRVPRARAPEPGNIGGEGPMLRETELPYRRSSEGFGDIAEMFSQMRRPAAYAPVQGNPTPVPKSPAPMPSPVPTSRIVASPTYQTGALNTWANSGGMDFLREQGTRAIEGSKAAGGTLMSGSTGTELLKMGQKLGSTYLNDYMNKLFDYAKLGQGSSGLLGSAGQWSKNSGSSSGESTGKKDSTGPKKGLVGMMSDAAAAYAGRGSDIRLKKNVNKIGELADGLSVYEYEYKEEFGLEKGKQIGVMADEVKELRPWAYIPNFIGEYAGVDYTKLGN